MRFRGTGEGQLDCTPCLSLNFLFQLNQRSHYISALDWYDQWDRPLPALLASSAWNRLGWALTFVTCWKLRPKSPPASRSRSNRRKVVIWVLMVGCEEKCPTWTWSAVTPCTMAPCSSLCPAPVAKAVLKPAKKPEDLGAVTPVTTPAW